MSIFEIITPGTWLDYEDRKWCSRVQGFLNNLKDQFFEANVALNLFEQTPSLDFPNPTRESLGRIYQRLSEIQLQVEKDIGAGISWEQREKVRLETKIRYKREQWSHGRIPFYFLLIQKQIYARAFLYALDTFDKFLRVLSKEPGVPPELKELHAKFAAAFPDLRGVRDTTQHPEDRARGLKRYGKPLVTKPVKKEKIYTQGGIIFLNTLNGSKFGATKEDGYYGEVDVAPESMERLQRILHEVLQSFLWRGPKRHEPLQDS